MDTTAVRAQRFVDMPFNQPFGLEFRARAPGHAEVTLVPRPEHLQVDGVIHGGTLATLADTAGVYAIYPDLPEPLSMTSIEFKLNFLRPALESKGLLTARATALKVGRSVATADVELHQDGQLIAKGLFTYLVLSPR